MKVLLVNGSPHEKGCTYTALSEIAIQLEKNGIGSEIHWLGDKPINGCTGCGACFRNRNGRCVFGEEDGVNELIAKISAADGVVFGCPVILRGRRAICTAPLTEFFTLKYPLRASPAPLW
jgi:multimeric flavodoxin WrbA